MEQIRFGKVVAEPCSQQTRKVPNHNESTYLGSVGKPNNMGTGGEGWGPAFFRVHAPDGVPPRGTQTTHSTPCHIEASSAGGEIWVAAFEGATRAAFAPKFGTSLWRDGRTDTRTHKSEIGPAGKTRLWEIRAH